MTAPAEQPDRPPTGPPPGWVYMPRDEPPPADQAACTPDDADGLLYALGHGAGCDALLDDARRLCQSCPVQAECLDYALTAGEDEGIWGGCTEKERDRLRKNLRLRGRPPAGPESIPHVVGSNTHDHRCGTRKGYLAHRKRGENACRPCLDANARSYHDKQAVLVGANRGGA